MKINFNYLKSNILNNKILLILIVTLTLIYLPALNNFFSADDWFHLRISNINNFQEFLNFFSFTQTDQTATHYRPIPTQLFFFCMHSLFGLSQQYYYLFVLSTFALLLFLLFRLVKAMGYSNKIGYISVILYGVSASNFSRIYFLSGYQDLLMTLFVVCSLIFFINAKNKKGLAISLIFFILGLLSKESAIITPLLISVWMLLVGKFEFRKILPFVLIGMIYLILRFLVFPEVSNSDYNWNFSPFRAIHTGLWYSLWSFGLPETMIDYIGNNFRVVPKFFVDYGRSAFLILSLFIFSLIALFLSIFKGINQLGIKYLMPLCLYLISLLPIVFLPEHKFALGLGLPLVGFSIILALIIHHTPKFGNIFLIVLILLNLTSYVSLLPRHYATLRARVARNTFEYFKSNYPTAPADSYFYFVNDTPDFGADWGSSKQIANSTGRDEMWRVLYNDRKYKVYYQDFDEHLPENLTQIKISTHAFLAN